MTPDEDEVIVLAAAIDNDLLLKSLCYGLTEMFWPTITSEGTVGLLGAAQFVVRDRLERAELVRDRQAALDELAAVLAAVAILEPTPFEIDLAVSIEREAAEAGVAVDAGESQLAAIVCVRTVSRLETGDKRAVQGMEKILDAVTDLQPLVGSITCLEQVVRRTIPNRQALDAVRLAICREATVDIALGICFSCRGTPPERTDVVAALDSYIEDLRRGAPRLLAPSSD